ncbi:hypothetical protein NUKP32_55750 [Klebsiella variicola]|uniref:host cell division inhibitor Icd-like protein n=1 Tax=Klebsiella variicola TaxID=244366 RepID=UPI0005B618A1|nr:host cell division inhibitor Icd-like protein [Klebsiella variicola]UVW55814.1 host cell division inhibitor Icd-like protein [Klebsiella variicola]CEP30342.1 hypothetical protein KV8917_340003 [Klebsiella variicola]SLV35580.1 Uncharacterised protein [Klebsiella variicola]SLW86229.1 Uncharacterised protein [Klebsiella variicola]SLY51730.1 Uncharacterised protein [Klebsiella variicola]
MTVYQHTQTHPKFTWRFLSISERLPYAKSLVIYVNASSEQEARNTMPGVNLFSLHASHSMPFRLWMCIMRKTFQVDGYAVNKRGNTVGIHYTLTSGSPDTAKSTT